MSDDTIRDTLAAQFRLAMRPDTVTEADVDLLGQIRLSLGIRAAVAYELTRALRTTKTAAKSSRRRTR